VCEKNLISLSPKYNNIMVIIEEIKYLSTLSVHDLMGSLEMHKKIMSRNDKQLFESVFQIKMNVKKSSNQNVNNHYFQ
jgi:diadenosine tetraphosphate (Ap4A) HIT family hydrolase